MSVNDSLKTSQNGLDHITKWEGLMLKRYICPAGKPTIGVGHVILPGENYATITKEQALEILAKDVERFEKAIKKYISVPLNQNQFDALVSFIFNTGEGGIINTSVQKAINGGDFTSVPTKLQEWCKFRVNGVMKINQGLLNRRKSESELFMKKEENTSESNTSVVWTKESLIKAQEKLASLGLYKLKIDGLWGQGTNSALQEFAKKNSLSIDTDLKKQISSKLFNALMMS